MKYLVCGEALIDLIHDESNTWIAHQGGGPFNTAIALARLGESVAFLGRLSGDSWGRSLENALLAAGVLPERIVPAAEPTSLAVVEVSDNGKADYTFYLSGTSNFAWKSTELPASLDGYQLLHIGTLALVVEPSNEILFEWLKRCQDEALIMIDLNARPSVISDASNYLALIKPWLSIADVIKASDDDLKFLYPDLTWQAAVAEIFSQSRVSLFAITAGAAGAHLVTREVLVSAAAPKVPVFDTVGAGDTFSAGLISMLAASNLIEKNQLPHASTAQLQSALEFAVAAAAMSCTKPGAQSPTRSEVESLLNDN
ncbi:MAG: carbohydrate kinase family protein [Candidatus Nanopelagicales bacterium]